MKASASGTKLLTTFELRKKISRLVVVVWCLVTSQVMSASLVVVVLDATDPSLLISTADLY